MQMKAMILNKLCNILENKSPLKYAEFPAPVPGDNEILVKVSTCGVCHTELAPLYSVSRIKLRDLPDCGAINHRE